MAESNCTEQGTLWSELPTKICSACLKSKPLSEFYLRKGKKAGHNDYYDAYCKHCIMLRARKKNGATIDDDGSKFSKRLAWIKPGKRRCAGCAEYKAFIEFPKSKRLRNGIQSYCKECKNNRESTRRRNDQEHYTKQRLKYYDGARWKMLLKEYGVTKEQYEEMDRKQDGKCAICKKPESFAIQGSLRTQGAIRKLGVDHCHKTGKIRGLLCTRCNRGLGYFNDDCDLLRKAIAYLESHQEQ